MHTFCFFIETDFYAMKHRLSLLMVVEVHLLQVIVVVAMVVGVAVEGVMAFLVIPSTGVLF